MTRAIRICFLAPNAFPVLAEDTNIPFVGGAELQQVMVAKGLKKASQYNQEVGRGQSSTCYH